MLVSEILEKNKHETAVENMANHLADRVRNIWLDNTNVGRTQWEENFYEGADAINFLRGESFPGLQGIDYIFKWWGNKDIEDLAGQLDVLWKVEDDQGVGVYRTWIRFADQDFVLGAIREETQKREKFRQDFRDALERWQVLYKQKFSK
jgi:hypothetical protein